MYFQLCSQLMFLSHSFIYSAMISFLLILRQECKGMFIPRPWKLLQIFLINLPQICLSSQNALCSRQGEWELRKFGKCTFISFWLILIQCNIFLINICEGNLGDDLMSLVYLTTLIMTMMFLSSLSKTTPLSSSSIPSYIWCISLPSLSLWFGWLSLAFIFDQLYLQIKGKLSTFYNLPVLNWNLFLSGAALSILIVLYIFLFLLSKISLAASTFKNHYCPPYQVLTSFNADI